MKLLKALQLKILGLNLAVFLGFSVIITFFCSKLPKSIFDYKKWLFRERAWENNGQIYQNIFRVRVWKRFMPELSDFIKSIFPKKTIKEYNTLYLSNYLAESCRAEMTHWNIILSSVLFSLWNDASNSFIMAVIAVILNMPYIIIQRYNRPRIIKLLEQKECTATA